MVRMPQSYLKKLFIFLAFFSALIAIFNAVVDPSGLFNLVRVDGVNSPKTETLKKEKLLKAMLVHKIKPEIAVLGSSRVAAGMDPNHRVFGDYFPRYNLGIGGSNIYAIRRYLQHVEANHSLKKVVIGLDFFGFNIKNKNFNHLETIDGKLAAYSDGARNIGYIKDVILSNLFSLSALSSAFDTLSHAPAYTGVIIEPLSGLQQAYYQGELLDFSQDVEEYKAVPVLKTLNRNRPPHEVFLETERGFVKGIYLLGVQREYYFESPDGRESSLDELRKIIHICKRSHIDLRLFISPVHARLLEAIRNIGLWPVFEQWKRELVNVSNEQYGTEEQVVPIWDFSGYNSVTSERVLDEGILMHYYYDSSHYRLAVGRMILDRMFGDELVESALPEDFGRILTPESVEDLLQTIRTEQSRYVVSHKKDVHDIETILQNEGVSRDNFKIMGGKRPVGGGLGN